jgi:hypothetical protein
MKTNITLATLPRAPNATPGGAPTIGEMTGGRRNLKSITQIRYDNFQMLLAGFKEDVWRKFPGDPEKGMLRKFAKHVGLTDAYASHINCQYKGIGHATARKIEDALNLTRGWMDQDYGQVAATGQQGAAAVKLVRDDSPPGEEQFLTTARELFRYAPDDANEALRALLSSILADKMHKAKP